MSQSLYEKGEKKKTQGRVTADELQMKLCYGEFLQNFLRNLLSRVVQKYDLRKSSALQTKDKTKVSPRFKIGHGFSDGRMEDYLSDDCSSDLAQKSREGPSSITADHLTLCPPSTVWMSAPGSGTQDILSRTFTLCSQMCVPLRLHSHHLLCTHMV